MLEFLTTFANKATILMGIDLTTRLGSSVSFFIEDTIKIFLLIYLMIFVISLFRKQLHPDKIKEYLSGKTRFYGYLLAVALGVVTPFCSCSSIPLFVAFIAAGIPFGITMAFLISSPLISEVATVLLLITPNAGVPAAIAYVTIGVAISILGGWLCDKLHLEKHIIQSEKKCGCGGNCHDHSIAGEIKSTIAYAHEFAIDTLKQIWVYVFIGLIVGAFMHGYIPTEFFTKYLGESNPLAVPLAAIAGIPIYANHDSVLPIVQVLLMKDVPIGTTLVMLMSITGISLPELIMLNKVLNKKILAMFVAYLFIAFIIVGYLLNFIFQFPIFQQAQM